MTTETTTAPAAEQIGANGAEKMSVQPVESLELMRLKNERALQEFGDPFESAAAYRHFHGIAEMFAASSFVPKHFQGKPAECLIALNIARRMNEDPLAVLQSLYVVGGKPGFAAAFMIARANAHAGFKSRIRWEVTRLDPAILNGFENVRVCAWALDQFGERVDSEVDTKMAIGEGWTSNAKYKTMLIHMLKFRSAAFLIRESAPEVMMGMQTVEELEDVRIASVAALPPPVSRTASLLEKLTGSSSTAAAAGEIGEVAPANAPDWPVLPPAKLTAIKAAMQEAGISDAELLEALECSDLRLDVLPDTAYDQAMKAVVKIAKEKKRTAKVEQATIGEARS